MIFYYNMSALFVFSTCEIEPVNKPQHPKSTSLCCGPKQNMES